jgi:PAS domain S-box-containing protein
MFDRDMKYLVVSRVWMEVYRLGDQSIIGRSHYEIFPDVPERWREIHRRCLAGATARSDEDAFTRADGTTDWLRWEIRPWHQADGRIGGIILFSEDISARKRGEAAQRAQLDELLRWQEVTLNREERVQQLKVEVNELLAQLRQPPRYARPDSS